MLRLLARLDSIDTRWLYLCTAFVVTLPLFVTIPLRAKMGHEARGVYDTIENMPTNSVVLVDSEWDAGVLGECKGQFTAICAHLMKRGIKFVVVSGNPQGQMFSDPVLNDLAKIYHRKPPEDFVQFGYSIPASSFTQSVQAMSRDFQGLPLKEKIQKIPAAKAPWLRKIGSFGDIALIVSFGYNPIMEWMQFGNAVYGTPYASALASINSTNMYPFLNSGQLRGMLVGARGGSEYEAAMGLPEYDRRHHTRLAYATRVIKSQSWAHMMLILGAVIGNIGFWARRRLQAREAE
jgi:hypothetical protein